MHGCYLQFSSAATAAKADALIGTLYIVLWSPSSHSCGLVVHLHLSTYIPKLSLQLAFSRRDSIHTITAPTASANRRPGMLICMWDPSLPLSNWIVMVNAINATMLTACVRHYVIGAAC